MIKPYPLSWPVGYQRTKASERSDSAFKQTPSTVQSFIRDQMRLFGISDYVISASIPVRTDGKMYAEMMDDNIKDPGVAIYFTFKEKQVSLSCDAYKKVWENLYAIAKSIEGLRFINRHKVSEFLERSFKGFAGELPASSIPNFWTILKLSARPAEKAVVDKAYKVQAAKLHPDVEGGSKEAFQELQAAYQQALKTYEP